MQSIDILKAAVIDNFSGKLLEDGAEILAKPITKICSLSITSVTFPNVCRVSELKSIFKKGKKTNSSTNFKNFGKGYLWPNKYIPLRKRFTM